MSKIEVKLIGIDGVTQAKGLIDKDTICDAHLVEHNRRLYCYKPENMLSSPIVFEECEECDQPYIITEF